MIHVTNPPALTSADPAHVHNQPFAVAKDITGTLAPFVGAFRIIHIKSWLQETPLQDVIETWYATQQEKSA